VCERDDRTVSDEMLDVLGAGYPHVDAPRRDLDVLYGLVKDKATGPKV
jgi:hypothetical protein